MRLPFVTGVSLILALQSCSRGDAFSDSERDASVDGSRDGFDGRLVVDSAPPDFAPPDIPLPPPEHVELAAGARHTCALRLDHTVWCWGANDTDQLGIPSAGRTDRAAPERLTSLPLASQIVAGARHTCALLLGGRVYCWGANDGLQCGRSTREPSSSEVPTAVAGLGVVLELAAGTRHTCARTNAGEVYCWGAGGAGQLGRGSLDDSATPSRVVDGAVGLAAGGDHTCALRLDRTVLCWGSNATREISLRATGPCGAACEPTPVEIPSVTGVSTLALGVGHTCVRTGDGRVSCWGDGRYGATGRLGPPSESPTHVPAFDRGTAVFAGFSATCGILADGSPRCMGRNDLSELGLPAGASSTERPTAVIGVPYALAVAIGEHHTCFAVSATEVMCVGDNASGQLGDGTTIRHTVAVPVRW